MATHNMQQLSRSAYNCEEHGVTVVLHNNSPLEFPPHPRPDTRGSPFHGRPAPDDPVYITKGKGERYHEIDSCYTLGRANQSPEVVVVSRSMAERDGRTPCLSCSKKP